MPWLGLLSDRADHMPAALQRVGSYVPQPQVHGLEL